MFKVISVVVADQWGLLFSRLLEILRQKHTDEYGECHWRYGSGAPAGGHVAPWGVCSSPGRTVGKAWENKKEEKKEEEKA